MSLGQPLQRPAARGAVHVLGGILAGSGTVALLRAFQSDTQVALQPVSKISTLCPCGHLHTPCLAALLCAGVWCVPTTHMPRALRAYACACMCHLLPCSAVDAVTQSRRFSLRRLGEVSAQKRGPLWPCATCTSTQTAGMVLPCLPTCSWCRCCACAIFLQLHFLQLHCVQLQISGTSPAFVGQLCLWGAVGAS